MTITRSENIDLYNTNYTIKNSRHRPDLNLKSYKDERDTVTDNDKTVSESETVSLDALALLFLFFRVLIKEKLCAQDLYFSFLKYQTTLNPDLKNIFKCKYFKLYLI